MPLPDLATIALVALAFGFAGTVKGVIGLGMPTVSMAVLTFGMPIPRALVLMIVPTIATNIWQALDGPHLRAVLRRLWPLLLGTMLGTAGGLAIGLNADPRLTTAALGTMLIVYALVSLIAFRPRVAPQSEPWMTPTMGAISGVIGGVTGIFLVPAIPYIGALNLARDALVQAMGITLLVSTLSLGAGLAGFGAISATDFWLSVFATLPAFLGMEAGKRLRHRLNPETFRRVFLVSLMLTGANLIIRALR
jgi:hypothetical protein